MTRVDCPVCGASLKVPESAAGKRVMCPKCQAQFTTPASVSVVAAAEEGFPGWAAAPAPEPVAPAAVARGAPWGINRECGPTLPTTALP
jgi:hypothetical protein